MTYRIFLRLRSQDTDNCTLYFNSLLTHSTHQTNMAASFVAYVTSRLVFNDGTALSLIYLGTDRAHGRWIEELRSHFLHQRKL